MQKVFKVIFLVLLLVVPATARAFASGEIEINRLISLSDRYDRQQVTVRGEAIGEPMDRSDGSCWINISDGTNAIGVKFKAEDAAIVTRFGNYKQKGDVIRVEGTFYRAAPEDGGEMDIHARSVEVVQKGRPVPETVRGTKVLAAAVLAALTGLFAFVLRRKAVV